MSLQLIFRKSDFNGPPSKKVRSTEKYFSGLPHPFAPQQIQLTPDRSSMERLRGCHVISMKSTDQGYVYGSRQRQGVCSIHGKMRVHQGCANASCTRMKARRTSSGS